MHTSPSLLSIHRRSQENLAGLLAHCRVLSQEELNRELEGFGYSTVRLQLHHSIMAQKYWIGVLEGRIDADDDAHVYPTVESLEALREEVAELATRYLEGTDTQALNTAKARTTWGGQVRELVPAQVFLRTFTHFYHHQGQVVAMCRLLGQPAGGLDYPFA